MFSRIVLKRRRPLRGVRKGAILVLVAVSLVILLIAAAFSVDVAYMHLVREELHVATDAAAKAAVTGLSLGGTKTDAINQAIAYAAKNSVAGAPLHLDSGNVQIGRVAYVANGRWTFTADAMPLTAASVTAPMASDTTAGPVRLIFGRLLGVPTFSPTTTSTAAFVRNKVCFCFDRSRSMTFDTSGVDESWPTSGLGYPNGVPPAAGSVEIDGDTYDFRWLYPPCTGSRWHYLSIAANTFLDALTTAPRETPVALLTWASSVDNSASIDYKGSYHTYTGNTLNTSSSRTSYSGYTLDSTFVTSYTPIRTAISAKNGVTMPGGTDMNTGLQQAVDLFAATDDGLPWNKIIILFSDGYYNIGSNPATHAALNAANANIVVHTVGFLLNAADSSAGAPTLQAIATATGGRHLLATDGASLKAAFAELARTLPVILTH